LTFGRRHARDLFQKLTDLLARRDQTAAAERKLKSAARQFFAAIFQIGKPVGAVGKIGHEPLDFLHGAEPKAMGKAEVLDQHPREFVDGVGARFVACIRRNRVDPVLAIILIRQRFRDVPEQRNDKRRVVLILVPAQGRSDAFVVRGQIEQADVSTFGQLSDIILSR
jgi:hypothetical protein